MVPDPVWDGADNTSLKSEENFLKDSDSWVNKPLPEDCVNFHSEDFWENIGIWSGSTKWGTWHPEWLSKVNVKLNNESEWVVFLCSKSSQVVESLEPKLDFLKGWEFENFQERSDSCKDIGIKEFKVPPEHPGDVKAVNTV